MSKTDRALLWISLVVIPAAAGLGLTLWLMPDEKHGLEKLYYAAATALAFLAAVATLTLVWVFLWEGTRAVTALKSAAYSQIYGRLADLSKALMAGCEARDWFADPPASDEERSRDPRTYLCDMAFSLFEEVYDHRHRFRLLDEDDWNGWLRTIRSFMSRRYPNAYWRLVHHHYPEAFVAMMNELTASRAP